MKHDMNRRAFPRRGQEGHADHLLKGILAGHLHIDVNDRFSPTAMQYVVAGNFMFRGQHVLFT